MLNVREATHKQIMENAEINNIIKIMGLQYNKKYMSPDDLKSLRYGRLMIMTDQDQDGSHIKGTCAFHAQNVRLALDDSAQCDPNAGRSSSKQVCSSISSTTTGRVC